MNGRQDLPGPGDIGYSRCSTDDTDIPAELVASVADSITERWLSDPVIAGEYSLLISDADHDGIVHAITAMDGDEVLCRYRIALRRVMRLAAMREAVREIERERRECENESAIERMET